MVYKFLKIGIIVGIIPHIETAIGDTRKQLILRGYTTWMAFIEKHPAIGTVIYAK